MGQREWVSGATVSSSLRAVGPNLVGCIRGGDRGVIRVTREDTELGGLGQRGQRHWGGDTAVDLARS